MQICQIRPWAALTGPAWATLVLTLFLTGCRQPQWFDPSPLQFPPVSASFVAPDLSESDLQQGEIALPSDSGLRLEKVASALSIEDAVLLALQNNSDLRVRRLNPLIEAQAGEIERGQFDPQFNSSLEYQRSEDYDASDGTVEIEKGISFNAELVQQLPGGTELGVSLDQIHTEDSDGTEQQTQLGISMTQALLRGGSRESNLVQVRQADLESQVSRYELRGFTEALVADTEIAYWQFVLAREKIAIYKRSYELVKKGREEIELRIQVGMLPAMEAAAAKAEEASRVQALVDAESQLESRRLELLRLISPAVFPSTLQVKDGAEAQHESKEAGIVTWFDLPLTANSNPLRKDLDKADEAGIEERMILAERKRADLSEARLRLEQNRLETIVTRNGLLPRLDFFIQLGKNGYGTSFSDSWQHLDNDGYDFSTGLSLSRTIGGRVEKAKDLAARAGVDQARRALENLRQVVRFDVRLAANEVERTRRLIGASEQTRIYSEAVAAAEVERFEVGTSTAILVAQAQRDLLRSQIDEIESVINYRISLIQLYLAEGSLLERRGVGMLEL